MEIINDPTFISEVRQAQQVKFGSGLCKCKQRSDKVVSFFIIDTNKLVERLNMFSRSSYPMRLSKILYELSESGKSNIAASKL